MAFEYKRIDVDSHCQEKPDAWTSRMSKAKWGDRMIRTLGATRKSCRRMKLRIGAIVGRKIPTSLQRACSRLFAVCAGGAVPD
jgi:hypothetical protein